MRFVSYYLFPFIFSAILIPVACKNQQNGDIPEEEKQRVLIFIKTNAYRHECIETGAAAIREYFEKKNLASVISEDSSVFTKNDMSDYDVVMFFNTSGNILDSIQEQAFMKYIQDGNGFVGVHAAADTEYDWAWYQSLVGAQFADHAAIQPGVLMKVDTQHASTKHLPDRWTRTDEWYNFTKNPSGVNLLLTADETTFQGGKHDSIHPMAWYHLYDGGRSFYSALGHTVESYQDTLFLEHLYQGVIWAAGNNK